MSNHENILPSGDEIRDLLANIRSIAVLGIKPEAKSDQPAFYVPQYLQGAGFEIIPVPVYFPEVTEILGCPVYRKLTDVPQAIDLLNIFRRPQDIPAHVDEILAKKPKAVWMQLGIQNDEVALQLAFAGVKVVQNKCLMVEHQHFLNEPEA